MNELETLFDAERKRIDSIKAPKELEGRLRAALDAAPPRKTKRIAPIMKVAVVVMLVAVVFGSNYNVLAYYGKQLFGFDELMEDTLKQLNAKGKGQNIEEKTRLKDGTDFTINGIIADANQLVMYYTLYNPHGLDQNNLPISLYSISGFWTNSSAVGGSSLINKEQTEIKGMMTFDSVSPFAKKLTLHYGQSLSADGQITEGTLTFPYNPNQALPTQIKQSIHKTLKVDRGSLTFQWITATSTQTVIKGTMRVDNYDRVPNALFGIKLLANGVEIPSVGSSTNSSYGRKFDFDIRYDALPEQLDSLELVMEEFVGYQELNAQLSLEAIDTNPFKLADKKLWIRGVSVTAEGIEIKLATEADVMLDGVSVETEAGNVELQTTIRQDLIDQQDGTSLKERTLRFNTTQTPKSLSIKGMHYMKPYNQAIEIPVK